LLPDVEGWVLLRPTVAEQYLGLITIFFAVLWIVLSVAVAFFQTAEELSVQIFFVGMFGMGVWFLHLFAFGYLAKVRFSDSMFEHRALWRRISVAWSDVEEIKMSVMQGPLVVTAEGKCMVSNFRRGFFQMLETARRNGVRVENSQYLR
jgi:hypothetical protein